MVKYFLKVRDHNRDVLCDFMAAHALQNKLQTSALVIRRRDGLDLSACFKNTARNKYDKLRQTALRLSQWGDQANLYQTARLIHCHVSIQ